MLTCSKCGKVSAPAPFCSVCGSSLLVGGVMPAIPPLATPPKTSGLAITGFVLSFVCGLLGLIFSLIGYNEVKKSQGRLTGEGFALAGIIISLVSVILTILIWVLFFRAVSEIGDSIEQSSVRYDMRRIGMSAKAHYSEHGAFPSRSFRPQGACCEELGKRCNNWQDPAWEAIGHEDFGSSRYRFGYISTPTTFEVIAVGDQDCDGDEVTYTLRVDGGDGGLSTGEVVKTGDD